MRRAPGTGCVYQSSTGHWWAAIYVGRKRVRRRCRSQAEAEAAVAEMIEANRNDVGRMYHLVRTGQWTRPAKMGSLRHMPRNGVTVAVRFSVLERDGFRCAYCGATPQTARLVIDHVIPVADGGTDDLTNLTTACEACNAGKAGRRLFVLPERLTG